MHGLHMKKPLWAAALSLLAALSATGSVWAQKSTPFDDWISVCAERDGAERCEIRQVLSVDGKDGKTPILVATVTKMSGGKLALQLVLPLGIDVRPGVVMAVDEKTERPAPVLTCLQSGCVSALELDDAFGSELRAGKKMKVGFRPFNTDQTMVVELSLAGYGKASQTIK
jgi:invasion protein IalB